MQFTGSESGDVRADNIILLCYNLTRHNFFKTSSILL